MEYLLKGVDSVLFILDAVDGVRPLTKKFWNLVQAEKLPAVIAINKLDRDRADSTWLADSLQSLGIRPVAPAAAHSRERCFCGLCRCSFGQGLSLWAQTARKRKTEVPAAIADDLALFRDVTAVENIAESDEALMEKYLLRKAAFRFEDLQLGLKTGVVAAGSLCARGRMLCPGKQGWSRHFEYSGSPLLPSPFERAPFHWRRRFGKSFVSRCPIVLLCFQNSFGSIFWPAFNFCAFSPAHFPAM